MSERDVAIVGMACVFPRAPDLGTYWRNLANGVDAIGPPPPGRWRWHKNFGLPPDHPAFLPTSRGGYLPSDFRFDPQAYGILPNVVRHGDPDQFLMLHVMDRALADAGVAPDAGIRARTDVIVGRGGYATGKLIEMTLAAEMFDTILEMLERRWPGMTRGHRDEVEAYLRSTLPPPAAETVSTAVSNIVASRPANRLNLRGAAYTVDGACASSLLAVEQAMTRLRAGACDQAVAAGIFVSLSPTFLYAFHQLGALSRAQAIRPFDRRADGLLVGEGGGAVVLKRLVDARRDGDRVYAILKGAASASDGREVDVLAPSSAGQVEALARAYHDAQVDPKDIGYLELHGTGTVVGDEVEARTVRTFFGTSKDPPTARAMGSVKSMIGHTMPAAGIAALIKTALSLSNKVLPPSLHCEQPRPDIADASFYLNTQTRPWIHNHSSGPRRAGVNAFGFGGINAHVVLEEAGDPHALAWTAGLDGPAANAIQCRPVWVASTPDTELVALAAATEADLVDQVAAWSRYLAEDQSGASLLDIAASAARQLDPALPMKAAFIARDRSHLAELLGEFRAGRRARQTLDGQIEIAFGTAGSPPGKVAFLFPGMGFPGLIGNYPDHLLRLCLFYPEVRAEFDFFEARDRHPDDTVPTSSIFCPPAVLPEDYRQRLKSRLAPPKVDQFQPGAETAAHERYLAAMGVTLANWAGWALLGPFGIPVDMMAGQSQGEMAALCAAGVGNFHATAGNFWKILNVDTRDASGGRLAFAWASEEKVAPLLEAHPGAHIAIYMAPEGIILGGGREALTAIAEKLQAEKVLVQLLPYPPIHTPSLSHLRAELLEGLAGEKFEIRRPEIEIYSSITAQKYPHDPDGIRETLLLNVDHPLRIWQTIRQMYADGARVFVQVGGGHMAAHLEMLLPEGAEIVTAALDVDTRDPITQLHCLCATLLTAGVAMDLAPLFRHRAPHFVDKDRPAGPPEWPRLALAPRIDWSPLYSDRVPAANGQALKEPAPLSLEAAPRIEAEEPAAAAPVATEIAAEVTPAAALEEPSPTRAMIGIAPPAEAAGLPVLGTITHWAPEEAIEIERWLDLDRDLFLADHLFVHALCKPLTERLPILPLTMSLEFLAEAASILAPGRGLIGFEDVRGHRWIGLEDKSTECLRIRAQVLSDDTSDPVRRIRGEFLVDGKVGFSGIAVFGTEYRRQLDFTMPDLSGAGPWPFPVEDVYGQRFMFHGPSFQCVAELGLLDNPGASMSLRVMPTDRLFADLPRPDLFTDPCLMDGIGQVIGLWAMLYEQCILPTSAERIEFYRPTPPIGTICPVRMEVIEIQETAKQIRANFEIEDGSGGVWVRIQGWVEWMLKWPSKYNDATRLPDRFLLSDELGLPMPAHSAAALCRRRDFKGADTDWAARLFLHSEEMAEFRALPPPKRRERLCAWTAAKDAARLWWSRQHGTLYPHPAELCIRHDAAGKPCLAPIGDPAWPCLSIAHAGDAAIAIASNVPVGVDFEDATRDVRGIWPHFATPAEMEILAAFDLSDPEANWPLRLWCAKEAVGKCRGTGLAGRPKDYEVIDGEGDGGLWILHDPSGERFLVQTGRLEQWIVAWTFADDLVGPSAGSVEISVANQAGPTR